MTAPHREPTTVLCNVCGADGKFILQEIGREGNLCGNCSASSRHRAVIYLLGCCLGLRDLHLAIWPADKRCRILESSGRGLYPVMLREKFEYYNTEYDPKSPLTAQPFTAFADFENLAYQDEQLDYVIATDVFEHVRQDDKAFSEVFRVLRKNGAFIMTVPYDHEWEDTLIRVKPEGDKDVFLLPPEYHGGGGQTLAYRKYGRDLLKRLQQHGFSVGYIDIEVPRFCIVKQFVFIAVKSSAIDLGKFYSGGDRAGKGRELKASPLFLFRIFVVLKYNMFSIRHFFSEVVRKLRGI